MKPAPAATLAGADPRRFAESFAQTPPLGHGKYVRTTPTNRRDTGPGDTDPGNIASQSLHSFCILDESFWIAAVGDKPSADTTGSLCDMLFPYQSDLLKYAIAFPQHLFAHEKRSDSENRGRMCVQLANLH